MPLAALALVVVLALMVGAMYSLWGTRQRHPLLVELDKIKGQIGLPDNPLDQVISTRIDRYVEQYERTGLFPDTLILLGEVRVVTNARDRFWLGVWWIEQKRATQLHVRFDHPENPREYSFAITAPEREYYPGTFENAFHKIFPDPESLLAVDYPAETCLPYEYSQSPVYIRIESEDGAMSEWLKCIYFIQHVAAGGQNPSRELLAQ